MQNNVNAVITMIRNRLAGSASQQEKLTYFHEKGITVTPHPDGVWFLRADPRGRTSELTAWCNGIIFRGNDLVCYHGKAVPEMSVEEAKDGRMIWNQKTVLYDAVPGQRAWMYWDGAWRFARAAAIGSPYDTLFLSHFYSVMNLESRFTYELILSEGGETAGLYLVAMYDVKNQKEAKWADVDEVAGRQGLLRPPLYAFTKFGDIEESDLPKYAQDQAMNRVLLTKLG